MNTIENIEEYLKMNTINKIFMDWDGVITHSVQSIVDIGNEMFGTNAKGEDVLSWNFKDVFPKLKEEDMEDLFSTCKFFERLKFIEGVVDFMKRHEKDIIIVTKARPENFVKKYEMLKSVGLENIPIIPIPFNVSKRIVDMFYYDYYGNSLFIDDNTDNLMESNADYTICFCEYEDNKEREWQKDKKFFDVMYHW